MVALTGEEPGDGGSSPLQMRDAGGARWWVKLLNNPQGPMVLVNEQIVARCGALIGAPTCEVAIVEVPEAVAGEVYGVRVEPGLAHGSRHVGNVLNERELRYRASDDNARRHVGAYAIHDWCWGRDSQWLYALGEEYKVYSHDHGYFFPNGPDWNRYLDQLAECVDIPHELDAAAAGVDAIEALSMSERLAEVSIDDLAGVLSGIPGDWPASDGELERLGFFLERRAPQVAGRLRRLAGGP